MINKRESRLKRAKRIRSQLKKQSAPILNVYRSAKHIRAQIIRLSDGHVMASASTLEASFRTLPTKLKKSEAALKVGQLIAERAMAKEVHRVGFDRAGFKYHGRVKALAEGARMAGLQV